MASSDVSSVTNHFSNSNEGFATTTTSQVLASATTVPLASTSGLTNGDIFVGIIEPGGTKEQTFTGTVDTSGTRITSVVWTRGTDVDHASGVSIVDYVTGTGHNMMKKGILVEHGQDGKHTNITVGDGNYIKDDNGNEIIKVSQTASAVNELTVKNAATGNPPQVQATGGDTNIGLLGVPKGTGMGAGFVGMHAVVKDWGSGTGSASVTGLPFAPRGFECFGTSTGGTSLRYSQGYAVSSGGNIIQGSRAGVFSGSAGRTVNSTTEAFVDSGVSSTNFVAAVTAFNSDGITVNKTTGSGTASDRTFHIVFYA